LFGRKLLQLLFADGAEPFVIIIIIIVVVVVVVVVVVYWVCLVVQSRSSADLQSIGAQASPLRRTASTRSLPGTAAAAKQRPQSVKPPPDPTNDLKAQARHLKAASSFREGKKRKVLLEPQSP